MVRRRLLMASLAVAAILVALGYVYASQHGRWLTLAALTVVLWMYISACQSMTSIFSLHKNEAGITWCQISILVAIGLWIVGFCMLFDAKAHPRLGVGIGVVGTVLGWIFQDTLKGVVAFVHLRLNHLLNIGDWIQVPAHGVDGEVKRVTLTTVTLYNWDTTTSTIPTSVLHSEHFINLQNMMVGKTYGRRMYKTFIIDTGCFRIVSTDEAGQLARTGDVARYLPPEEIRDGMTNAQLFRLYLFHWLQNHPHVSQQPRLIVRWLEHTECGMPLQVYAFITDSSLTSFEWQQSQIMEHIIESLEWFGLRLYQRPAANDVRQLIIDN
ncbi:MAG: mechanosensitive ion channel [Prevotella sp.]|nr:mechanosensitive ion channel [Prevotella sp.]